MSRYYKQMQHGDGEAARLLQERLARKEMGDAAYDKAASYADDRTFLWHAQDLVSAFLLFLSGGLVLPPAGGAGQPRLDAHFAEDGRLALLPLGLFLLLGIPYLLEGGVPLLDPNHWVLMALLGCAGVAYLRGGRVRAGATVAFALVTTWAFVFVWVRPGA